MNTLRKTLLRWFAPLALGLAATPAWAVSIFVSPSAPTVEDTVTITVGAIWRNTCVPQGLRATVEGKVVRVVEQAVSPELICGQALTGYSLTVQVGPLAQGLYTIDLYREGKEARVASERFSVKPAPVKPPAALEARARPSDPAKAP